MTVRVAFGVLPCVAVIDGIVYRGVNRLGWIRLFMPYYLPYLLFLIWIGVDIESL
jgi:hypothetical protein